MNAELLEKYLNGKCTAEEIQQVKGWLEKDPGMLKTYMQQASTEPVSMPMPADMEAELLATFRKQYLPVTETPVRKMQWRKWTAAAAAILVGVFMLTRFTGIIPSHDYVTVEPGGMVQKLVLPDQSVVWLKPGASLRYDRNTFNKEDRHVTLLKGESFFEVVHNAAKPFVVESGNIATTDIGTAFSVRDDAAHHIIITVASGEVAVSHDHKMLSHVLPGNQFFVDQQSGTFSAKSLPIWMAAIWKENELQLNNVSFDELSLAMQQFYNVTLHAASKTIGEQTYTIQLKRQMPADQVISTVCMLNQNSYDKKQNGNYLIH